ncbi:class I SAM-dependent methyltransferase [Leptospira santarosai]|uniref:class I SAM-dependent methyltransferase n=1 Tax=Leptospira santarosai TaxID=28183 RepID=UPI0002BFA338|nr:class I SAM-dependent methyltransferase [Leptospira santarosai]EMP02132.1 methyltransferase domain protein [Leptospira santarosai str. HAI1380]
MKNDNADATIQFFRSVGVHWLVDKSDEKHMYALLQLIKMHINKSDEILDICCGYGRITIPLLLESFIVKGMDISPELIGKAILDSKKCGISGEIFEVADMKKLPYKDNVFDFSFCVWASFNFLNNKEDQITSLNEMYRTLKIGGKVLIECPYHENFDGLVKVEVGNHSYDYFPITIEQMVELKEKTNFSELKLSKETLARRERMIAIFIK